MPADYDFDISNRPDFALLAVQLQAGQSINAEPAAMASMDNNILMKASFKRWHVEIPETWTGWRKFCHEHLHRRRQ